MAKPRTPRTPRSRRQDPYAPKAAIEQDTSLYEPERLPQQDTGPVGGGPSEADVMQMIRIGVDPEQLYGKEAVEAAMPKRQAFDETQAGYWNTEETVWDSEGVEVGDFDMSPFVLNGSTGTLDQNPAFSNDEFNQNFWFSDRTGNWMSSKTGNPILDKRQLTDWENTYMHILDPGTKIMHQLMISGAASVEKFADMDKANSRDGWESTGSIFLDSVADFGIGMGTGFKELIFNDDDNMFVGFGYGWRTDAAPHQGGWFKAIAGTSDNDPNLRQWEIDKAKKYDNYEAKQFDRAFQMNYALVKGSFTDEDSMGYKFLSTFNRLKPSSMTTEQQQILMNKSMGRTIENYVSATGAFLMSMADPATAVDIALTGGASLSRKLRYLKIFDLAGDSRRVFDQYKAINKAYGPEVLMEVMKRNNRDQMNADYWAKTFSMMAKRDRSIIPFKDMLTRTGRYDVEKLKTFIGIDPDTAMARLGGPAWNKLTKEILPPTSTINGKLVYNYDDIWDHAYEIADMLTDAGKTKNSFVMLMDDLPAKALRPQSVVSMADSVNYGRKVIENIEETSIKIEALMDNLTSGQKRVSATREQIADIAATVRFKRGFGVEKFTLDNFSANQYVEDVMSMKMVEDGAAKVLATRRLAPESHIEDMVDLTRQLSDPAIVSTTGVSRVRGTDWNKFTKKIESFAKRPDSWWNNFITAPESFRFQFGGKMGGVTTDAIRIVKRDMAQLRRMTRNLDTYEANINKIEKIMKKYPKLKMPTTFAPMTIGSIDLQFGPISDNYLTEPGLENIKNLSVTLDDPMDAAGRLRPEAVDVMNLWVAQRRIWDGPLLNQKISEAGFHVDKLKNGIIPGGRWTTQGEVIDALLGHAGLGDYYKAMKSDNLWSVVESKPYIATDAVVDVMNNKVDSFSTAATKKAVNNPNVTKGDLADDLVNGPAKASIRELDAEVRLLPGPSALSNIADTLWQPQKVPGGAALGDITPSQINELLGDNLLDNWRAADTPEKDAKLLTQLRKHLDPRLKIYEADDYIALFDGTEELARAEGPRSSHGKGLMADIAKKKEEGTQFQQLYSVPLPDTKVVGKALLGGARLLDDIAKNIADGVYKRSPKKGKAAYKELKRIVGEKSAKVWLDARERFGDGAYRELLRMREIWIRNNSRHEVMNTILGDIAQEMGIEKTWKNWYLLGKFRNMKNTESGQKMLKGLENMFNAPEGILEMPANATAANNYKGIKFGTRQYKTYRVRDPMDIYPVENGVTVAKPGFKTRKEFIRDPDDPGTWNTTEIDGKTIELNPQNSQMLWDKLTPVQKKYIAEYTRKGGTNDTLFNHWKTFNREVALEYYNITSNREGYMHHSFVWDDAGKGSLDDLPETHDFAPIQGQRERDFYAETGKRPNKLKTAKAGPKRQRIKNAQSFKRNFLESVADYNLKLDREAIRNDAMMAFERKVMINADELAALRMSNPSLADRMAEYRPVFDHGDIPSDMPMYVDSVIYTELKSTSGLSKELGSLNKVLRIGKLQLLAHPGTFARNAAGGALQFALYGLDNINKAVIFGDAEAGRKLKNMGAAFVAAAQRRIPAEVFGSRSNIATEFGQGTGPLNEFIRMSLIPMGGIENFFKRALMETEMMSKNLSLDDLVNQEGRIKDMDNFFDIDKVTDFYAFDYDNKSQLAEWFQRNPVGVAIAPFATYPYKYSKMVAGYLSTFNPRSWTKLYDPAYEAQVGMKAAEQARLNHKAKFVTAMSLIMTAAAEGLMTEEKDPPTYKQGMDYRFDSTGRARMGWMDEDSYMRYTAYPGLNIYEPIRKAFTRVKNGSSLGDTTSELWDEFTEMAGEMFNVGSTGSLVMNAAGHRNKYEQNKTFAQLAISKGMSHVPYVGVFNRLGPDANRLIEQGMGHISRTKRDAWAELATRVPGSAFFPSTQGDVTRFSRKREDEVERVFAGINIRRIDTAAALKDQQRVKTYFDKKEERDAANEEAGEYVDRKSRGGTTRRRRRRRR